MLTHRQLFNECVCARLSTDCWEQPAGVGTTAVRHRNTCSSKAHLWIAIAACTCGMQKQ